MYPILIRLNGITLHTYGLMVAIGLILGLLVALKLGKTQGIPSQELMDTFFYTVLVAILGSRLGFFILEPSHYLEYPLDAFKIWEGGLVFSFGLVFGGLTFYWITRRRKREFLASADIWMPGLALGQAIGRIGCFMAGCCFGRETDSWLAVKFSDPNSLAPLNLSIYPTQLFHSLGNFIIFAVLLILFRHRSYKGQVLAWYMILHPVQRLIVEQFRGDFRGQFLGTGLTATQALSLLVLITGVVLSFVLRKKKGAH